MSFSSYRGLKAELALWLKRTDLTTNIVDFIALAESRMNHELRLRRQITTTTLVTVANDQDVTLPTDFLEFENLTLQSSPPASLSVVTPEILDRKFPASFQTGMPQVYAPIGNVIRLGPTPDAAYNIAADYYAKWDLATTQESNWLLTNYPVIYLAGAMMEASAYLFDDQAMARWEARFRAEMDAVQKADDMALRSGSAMRVRAL